MRKNGLECCCRECELFGANGADNFEITVPFRETSSGEPISARFRCTITKNAHTLELTSITEHGRPAREDVVRRARALIASIEAGQVCGSKHLCPPDVVRLVAANA